MSKSKHITTKNFKGLTKKEQGEQLEDQTPKSYYKLSNSYIEIFTKETN